MKNKSTRVSDLVSEGIGLSHFNEDLAWAHRELKEAYTKERRHQILMTLYRLAFNRGGLKSSREALKALKTPQRPR